MTWQQQKWHFSTSGFQHWNRFIHQILGFTSKGRSYNTVLFDFINNAWEEMYFINIFKRAFIVCLRNSAHWNGRLRGVATYRPYAYDVTEGRPAALGVKRSTATWAIAKHAARGATPVLPHRRAGLPGPAHWEAECQCALPAQHVRAARH